MNGAFPEQVVLGSIIKFLMAGEASGNKPPKQCFLVASASFADYGCLPWHLLMMGCKL